MSHKSDPPNHPPKPPASHRTTGPAGRKVRFWFEGRRLEGVAGESIAKALFDNGIRTLSNSLKYGRPRGIHCGRGRCIMCHVEVDGQTGVRACTTPLAEGMAVNRQRYKPFYGRLLTAAMRRIHFPAGFYYRMFTRPRLVHEVFVSTVRRVAGVGRIDAGPQPPRHLPPPPDDLSAIRDRYDVVVVGAGVSGMAAALAAAASADVLLVDEYADPGGHAAGRLSDGGMAATRDRLLERIGADLPGHPAPQLATGVTAQGFYDPGRLLLGRAAEADSGGGLRVIGADAFVFATGAHDVIPLFENNDLPGIYGSRAVRLFLERDGLVPGRQAVVYGNGRALADTVALLDAWGVRVEAVADTAVAGSAGTETGARILRGTKLVGVEGRGWVERAVFESATGDRVTVPCDMVCVAVPGQPSFELPQQAGFQYRLGGAGGRDDLKVMLPITDALDDGPGPKRYVVGEAAGISGWEERVEHATRTGNAAARGDNAARGDAAGRSTRSRTGTT